MLRCLKLDTTTFSTEAETDKLNNGKHLQTMSSSLLVGHEEP